MNAKKIFKRYLPDQKKLQNNKHLRIFGKYLLDPNIWHLNRYSCAKAFAIGLFISYIPAPGHTPLATLLSIIFRANLPVSVALVWIVANPFAMPAMYYFGYKVGAWLLGLPVKTFQFELTFHWLWHEVGSVYPPMLLGSLICGALLSLAGYVAVRLFWRYSVSKAWKARAQRPPRKHPTQ